MDELYKRMLLIRKFEERILSEFALGKLVGTTHTYIGQEADAVGILSEIAQDDVIFSNHRCHGHYLAYGGDPYLLAAELMGKETGLVGGRGGSQHIQYRNFYSNGVQGGIVPVAVGMALAEKFKGSSNIVLCFIGDGTLGEGVLYESINIASLWSAPIIFILENNRYAQTTPINLAVSGTIAGRFTAFNIPVWEAETNDVLVIREIAREAISQVRTALKPACLVLHTYRFSAHSKGDDTRAAEELAKLPAFDPITLQQSRLSSAEENDIERSVAEIINDAFNRADTDLFPALIIGEGE